MQLSHWHVYFIGKLQFFNFYKIIANLRNYEDAFDMIVERLTTASDVKFHQTEILEGNAEQTY